MRGVVIILMMMTKRLSVFFYPFHTPMHSLGHSDHEGASTMTTDEAMELLEGLSEEQCDELIKAAEQCLATSKAEKESLIRELSTVLH